MYLSCQLAPPNPLDIEAKETGFRQITCIDENGQTWWLTENSEVGDYLRYIETGGTIEPYVAPAEET